MTNFDIEKIHATSVDIDGIGILLQGPSGSGKSDLALRLIDEGSRLIADDYTDIIVKNEALYGAAPDTIEGLIEVRGQGVFRVGSVESSKIGILIDLVAGGVIERLPEEQTRNILGIPLLYLQLAPFEASATAKIRLAVKRVKGDITPAS